MSRVSKNKGKLNILWAGLRIILGVIFLWAFFDKLLGLGFATCRMEDGSIVYLCEKSWIGGGSPTSGFLTYAAKGPFVTFFNALAHHSFIDWLFMLGILGIGIALTFGILIHLASVTGSLLMFLMWVATFPPQNNPLFDEHIVYIGLLVLLAAVHAGRKFGFGTRWDRTSLVKKHPWFE